MSDVIFDPFDNINQKNPSVTMVVQKKSNTFMFDEMFSDNIFSDDVFDFNKHKEEIKESSEKSSDESSDESSEKNSIISSDIYNSNAQCNKLKEKYEVKSTIISENHTSSMYTIRYTNYENTDIPIYIYDDSFYESILYCQKTFLNPNITKTFSCDCTYYPVAQRQIINDISGNIGLPVKYHDKYINLIMKNNTITYIKIKASIKTRKDISKTEFNQNVTILCNGINDMFNYYNVTLVNNVKYILSTLAFNNKKTKQHINLLLAIHDNIDKITNIINKQTVFDIENIYTKKNPFIIKYIADANIININNIILNYGFTHKKSTVLYNNTIHVYNISNNLNTVVCYNSVNLFDKNLSMLFRDKYIFNFDADEVTLTNNIDNVLITNFDNKSFIHCDDNETLCIPFLHTFNLMSYTNINKISEILGLKFVNVKNHNDSQKNIFNFGTIATNSVNEPYLCNFYKNGIHDSNFLTTINTKDTLSIVCVDLDAQTININEHDKQIIMDDHGFDMLHFGQTKSFNDKYCFDDRIIYLPNPSIKIYQNNINLSNNLYKQIIKNKYVPIGKSLLNYLNVNLSTKHYGNVMKIIKIHDVNFDIINV
jgi:hypothetical protein